MNEFLIELYKLMERYGASIIVDIEYLVGMEVGNTGMSIEMGDEKLTIAENSCGFDSDDLKAYLDARAMQAKDPD